jgi:glycosyltransferase involved in cell wall biosynthesis
MLVNYVIGEKMSGISGVSRYREMIYKCLKNKVEFNVIEYRARALLAPVQRYFYFPRMVKKMLREGLIHITGQQQAFILDAIDPKNSVVTTYDIFNIYALKNRLFRSELQKSLGAVNYLFFKLETQMWVNALKKAEKIIAISEFTKKEIVKHFNYPAERVKVTLLGVDSKKYVPLRRFKKPNCFEKRTILHVGGTELRENASVLVKAFYILKKKLPDVKMVKIGRFGHGFRELITKLRLSKDVYTFRCVPEKDLPIFYNSASALFYPSVYEGFGLPPLEAMACGLPVVTSNAASLPEVVGDAGIMKHPNDIKGFANALYEILANDGLRKDLTRKGLKRAKLFRWEKTAAKTLKVYEEVYPG